MGLPGDEENERKPLMVNEPQYYGQPNQHQQPNEEAPNTVAAAEPVLPSYVASVGTDELPPSYQATMNNSGPTVTCRVCQQLIDVSGKKEQHVVKCSQCNEATPVRNPPPGKKYVRCPCNCLLICKSTSQRIACPRPNCKRIINLSPSPLTPPMPSIPGMCKVSCVHCRDTFLFNTLKNALARCPHCRRVSSVGPQFARGRGKLFIILSILLFICGAGITGATYSYAASNGGIIFAYVAVFSLAVLTLSRSIYYYTMKISTIEGPI